MPFQLLVSPSLPVHDVSHLVNSPSRGCVTLVSLIVVAEHVPCTELCMLHGTKLKSASIALVELHRKIRLCYCPRPSLSSFCLSRSPSAQHRQPYRRIRLSVALRQHQACKPTRHGSHSKQDVPRSTRGLRLDEGEWTLLAVSRLCGRN